MGKLFYDYYDHQIGVYHTIKKRFKFIALGLLSALFLFSIISNANAATTVIISGNTATGENQPGWLFNRDVSTSTPFEFNTDQASIGSGSLYIEPISSNPSDKFVGENFLLTPIADVDNVSYDFRIGNGGNEADKVHFYMNVYANFGSSSPTKFYDCRYNIMPTSGSTSSFTTNAFDPEQSYPVTKHESSPHNCPSSPADMNDLSPGSTIRMFSLNVGDTSDNDSGLDGYLDNVMVSTSAATTTYDFEYNPDPQNKHQMSISGNVHRDHSLNHCYNKTTCEDRAENLGGGWNINLYKEASDNSWEFVKSTQTNTSGDFAFSAVKEAGVYHVCEVLKAGWTQQTQNWSGTPYHIATDNLSGNDSEGPYCRTINYADTGNYSNKFYFGNVDTKKPSTEVISPVAGTVTVFGGVYNSSFDVDIRTTDNESGIVQAIANLYGPSGLIRSCVNQPVSPAATQYDYTCSVDIADLNNGDYYLKINSKDAAGHTSNTITWNFTIDKTAPHVEITNPGDNTIHNGPVDLRATVTDDNPHHYWLQIKKNGSVISIPGVTGTQNESNSFTNQLLTTLNDEGKYVVTLAARDAAGGGSSTGNRSGDIVVKFIIDKSDPEINISNVNVSTDKKLSFDLLATDNGPSGLQIVASNIYDETNTTKLIELGTGNPTRLNVPHSGLPEETPFFDTSLDNIDVSSLSTGTYTIRAYAKDHAGNELRFKLVQFEVDNTPPAVPTLISPIDNVPINGTSPVANDWEDVDDAAHYIYQSYNVDGNGDCIMSPIRFSSIYTASQTNSRVLAHGLKFCWQVKAVDVVGNESDWSELWKTVVDNVAPDEPTANPAAGIYTGPQDIELSSNDDTSGVDKIYYTLDGSDPDDSTTEYTGPINITEDTTLKAIAYDNAGNASSILTAEYGIAPIISDETAADPITTESITPPQNTSSNNNFSSSSNNGNNTFASAANTTPFNTFGTFGTTVPSPAETGNVLNASNDNDGNSGETDGEVQANSAGVSSATTAETAAAAGKSIWSWWWILPIIAAFLILFAVLRRRSEEE